MRTSARAKNSGEKELEKLRKFHRGSDTNKKCFDCGERGPTYVVMEPEFKVFVCTSCSGLHRELAHKVKGISVSKWTEEEVDSIIEGGGNDTAENFLLANWRPKDDNLIDSHSVEKMRNFIRMKYQDRKWVSGGSRRHSRTDQDKYEEQPRSDKENRTHAGTEAAQLSGREQDASPSRGSKKNKRRESDDFNPGGGSGDCDWGNDDPFGAPAARNGGSGPSAIPSRSYPAPPASGPADDMFTLDNPNSGTMHQNNVHLLPSIKVLTKEQISLFSLEEVRKLQNDMEEHMQLMMRTMNEQIRMLKERSAALHSHQQIRLESQQQSAANTLAGAADLELSGLNLDFNPTGAGGGINTTPSQMSVGAGSIGLSSLHSQNIGGGAIGGIATAPGSFIGGNDVFSQSINSGSMPMNQMGASNLGMMGGSPPTNVQQNLGNNGGLLNSGMQLGMSNSMPPFSSNMPMGGMAPQQQQSSMGHPNYMQQQQGSNYMSGYPMTGMQGAMGMSSAPMSTIGGGSFNPMTQKSPNSSLMQGGYKGGNMHMLPPPTPEEKNLTSLDTLVNFQTLNGMNSNPFGDPADRSVSREERSGSGNPFDM